MISAKNQQVVVTHPPRQLRQPAVEILERARITFGITAMTIEHVEVDKIGEDDRAVACLFHHRQRRVEQRGVAARLDLPRNALVRINVGDFSNADDIAAALDQLVEYGRRMRRRRQVASVTGADIAIGTVANKRPRDDPADPVFIDKFTSNVAEVIQSLQTERLFMAGNLKHAVGRRVDNRLACPNVFVTELGNDGRAGGVAVTEHARQGGPGDQLV